MKRTAEGYKARWCVKYIRRAPGATWSAPSRPCLMGWAAEVAERLRRRGCDVVVELWEG